MLFNSYVFIFVFLPAVLAVYAFLRRHPERAWSIWWLVLASLVYYAWWRVEFVLLIVASILVNYGFGKVLLEWGLPRSRAKAVMVAGIALNLSVLAYFKYTIFFVKNANRFFDAGFAVPEIILPIGISFITFQKIAFLVDAYRGQVRALSLANFALFVTFFPQLIAGPIVHHSEVMPQFARTERTTRMEDLAVGLSIFCIGLFKKVVVADTLAIYADAGYATIKAGQPLDPASAWIAVLAFSFQLYYDFSGYSDMAVGLARLFGIRFPANFHSPYKASGIIDFWRRWHITLSRFLRDYLYIPLGGNRVGKLRQYANVTIVMLLGGLWHGANWTFVAWGAIHGLMLAANHAWQQLPLSRLAFMQTWPVRALAITITFLAVTLAWIPFRAENMSQSARMFRSLFADWATWQRSFEQFWDVQFANIVYLDTWFKARELWPATLPPDFLATYRPAGLTLLLVIIATFTLPNTNQIFAKCDPVIGLSDAQLRSRGSLSILDWKVALVVSGALVVSVLQLSRVSPFLYYQF